MTARTQAERLAALETRSDAHDREFRDLRVILGRIEQTLCEIHDLETERRGFFMMGRWVVGGSFLATLGAAVAGVWHFFAGRVL